MSKRVDIIRKTRPCTTVGNVFEECHVPYIFKTPLQISKMSRDIIAASKAKLFGIKITKQIKKYFTFLS
jgi:hypothetical protein